MRLDKLIKIQHMLDSKREDKVPAGFKNRYEWQKEFNLSESATTKKIRNLVDTSLMEVRFFKKRTGMVCRPVPYYRIK